MKKLFSVLSIVAFIFAALATFFVRALHAPAASVFVTSLATLALLVVALIGNRSGIVNAFDSFRAGQSRIGVFALLLFAGIAMLHAASNIEDAITSLVIHPSGTRTSDTNGLIRLYSANESNWFGISTNLDFVFATATGMRTGYTGVIINTNSGAPVTNNFKTGVHVGTGPGVSL